MYLQNINIYDGSRVIKQPAAGLRHENMTSKD